MKEYYNLLRLRFNHIQINTGKRYIDVNLEKDLFKSKELVAEEKIDGSQTAIGWKSGKPYAQARSGHLPDFDKRVAFDGFWSWIWANVEKIERTKGHLVFGEWMKPMHSVLYDDLPDFFIAFDVYNLKSGKYLNFDEKTKFLTVCGISQIPVLHIGKIRKEDVPNLVDGKKSSFSLTENMEGCVIKDYNRQMFCKYVCREFLDKFDDTGHWTSREKVKYNRLKEWRI